MFEKSKAKTNFQKIKEMSEEELAEFIWKTGRLGQTFGPCGFKLWLEWMREESE